MLENDQSLKFYSVKHILQQEWINKNWKNCSHFNIKLYKKIAVGTQI